MLEKDSFKNKKEAREHFSDLKISLKEIDAFLTEYIKKEGTAPENIAFASNLEKKALTLKEKLNKMPMAKLAYVLDKAFKSKVAV